MNLYKLIQKQVFDQYFCSNTNQNNSTQYFHIEFESPSKVNANSHTQKAEQKTHYTNNADGIINFFGERNKYNTCSKCVDTGGKCK